jgi:Fic family protein
LFINKAPAIPELIAKIGPEKLGEAISTSVEGEQTRRYLHWDKLRHLSPPTGLSTEQWWLKIKLARNSERRQLLLRDPEGRPFGFTLPDQILRHLHHIDQRCSGEVAMDEVVTSEEQAGQRFLVNSLMEEAIRSSQLEGATTSRRVAKEMLRSGRQPRNRSERMIANNYRALQFMREEMGETLTPETVLELHRILTEGTLDDPSAAGRLQRPDEVRVAVYDRDDEDQPIHVPPPAAQLPERLELLCRFANEDDDGEQFMHPVVRAIMLHLWLAYDHPFEDGNGRTARILFFWSMRTHGYWLAEYLPISRFIRKAPARYARAFLETETDDGDATYFLIHQLNVIELAIDDLHIYLQRKIAEVRNVEKLLRGSAGFNHRQLAVLTDAVRHSDSSYSFASHATGHRVSHETARSDLMGLTERGLLRRRKRGRRYVFEPAQDLPDRLKESAA